MPTRQEKVATYLETYSMSVPFDVPEPMKPYRTIHKEGGGIDAKVPYYCAGFFVHPSWSLTYREEKGIANQLDYHILNLPGAEHLDRSLRAFAYGDETNCQFLCLHDNIANSNDWDARNRSWLERRDKQLKLLCSLMELEEDEIEMVKRNFSWHLFTPRVHKRVPLRMTLHKPSALQLTAKP
ncbi:hypothetical protein D9619_012003 [Psilocybe cf. subviscida]|uniref:Uncharacterized protein n=1 Tax=Psilocybe cf. subviscida TaxID=2480587 RepID=A0A8H5EW05_9AGAR|nr:hypothetical protein D9619_012003 [Psilocybe cf. subviscida]